MEVNQHRTWAEIDLGAIEHNYRVICEQAQAPVLCVVKADAYGHGAVQVAKRLEKMDAPYFAVATIPEGAELREAGIETPILILGYVDEKDMDTAAQYGITVPVYDRETAELISAAAERTGKPVTVHYKLDTGMTRLGFPSWECEQTVQDILACSKLPGLISEGIFTHFAVADVPSGEVYTELQYKRFSDVCEGLQAAGLDLPLRHCANSGAIQTYEKMHCTMTRAGIILYGYRPDASVPPVLDLRPAMTVKARVVQVRDIPANTTISYGRTVFCGSDHSGGCGAARSRHRNAHPHPWLCGREGYGHGGTVRHHRAGVRPRNRRAYQRGGCPHGKARYRTLQAGYRHDAARLPVVGV